MSALHPFHPPVVCATAQSTTDLLRSSSDETLAFFDTVDRFAGCFGVSTGLVAAVFNVRMLDMWHAMMRRPTEASGRGVRHRAHEMGLPVLGGGR